MKVKNLKDTGEKKCKCDSWLDHWKRGSGGAGALCAVLGCTKTATVGGHVKKVDANDDSWYIVPLCDEHNRKLGEELEISSSVKLVSANVSQTCGK